MLIGKSAKADPLEDIDDEQLDDTNLEDEGLDSGVDEAVDDAEQEDVDERDEDDSTEEEEDTDAPIEFDKKQQAEVNKIVKARLDRHETSLVKGLSKFSGVEITKDELPPAARLWGLLKANPQLSKDVDALIGLSITEGKATAPVSEDSTTDAIQQRLELKEAILDLKAADPSFSKNADKILAWAEKEGYEIANAKTLKLAVLAWKGSQGKVTEVVQKKTAQRKQEVKSTLQKRATVQSTKVGSTQSTKVDYRKMSDRDVLRTEGISLFTDD